jgi:hypothetical protein
VSEGLPLYHLPKCLPYRLLANESPVISNAALSAGLAAAFAAWSAPNDTCTPGISAIELSTIAATTIAEYRNDGPNDNLVGVVSEWKHEDTLALTTVVFRTETGEILGVDMELNGTVSFSIGDPDSVSYDLQSVLTHEAGHMLGLAHSTEADATMFPSYAPGSIEKRTLSADDQLGICAIYPNREQRVAASGPVPSTACDLASVGPGGCGDVQITHGCSTTPSRKSFDAMGVALVAALAGIFVRRKPR